ncbi:murein biosynthesis integral membrane protein MurJ [Actinomyces trachealis]|uniref:murein biosynthesis integral membrane protein MurJ n=1 Tax=Actinomyces trachealis TaxID=2763540 RepID=UPI0018C64FF6|nr:murein biosynthesis integral membrane protein MurJ [Actinomyces trachealis]
MSPQKRHDSEQSASLARSSAIMFAGTLVSRLLGFVRNALVVVALGATASGAADAFNTANALPTQLYNLLLGGILNAVLVPQIVRALKKDNGDDVVNRLLTAAGTLVAVVTGVMTIASPLVVLAYASGLGRWQPLAVAFTFWCMPQIFFYGLTALWGQVLNARERFGPYMWAPVINNVIAIASLFAYIKIYGSYAAGETPAAWTGWRIAVIAGGATLGIVVQALALYVPLRQIGFRPKLLWGVRGIGLKETSIVASWALAGILVTGIADIAWTNLGSLAVVQAENSAQSGLIVPSTTMWNNAQLIYILPQSLVTTSIVTALFTRMSVKAAESDGAGVRDDFSLGSRSVAVFTMLASAGIAVLATPALQTFVPSLSLAEAQASAPILVALALGIVPQGLCFTTQRVLLAYTDTRRLFWVYVPVGLIPVVSAFFIHKLAPAQHWMTLAGVVNTAINVIAAAMCVPFMLHYLPDLDAPRITRTHLRLGAAAGVAAVVGIGARALLGPADGSMTGRRPVDALVTILVVAFVMTVVYVLVAMLMRTEEITVVTGPASRILRKMARLLGPVGGPLNALAERMAPKAVVPAQAAAEATADAVAAAGAGAASVVGLPRSIQPRSARSAATVTPAPITPAAAATPQPHLEFSHSAQPISQPGATMGPGSQVKRKDRGVDEGKPIGSGRYRVLDTLPTTLPHIIRHRGKDTILDRDVTILLLTPATAYREEVLSAAARAVLIDDQRCQRIYDVDQGREAFIVSEPISGVTLPHMVEQGLGAAQARAIIGEAAEALASASLRNLHHLVLRPESIRVDASGQVKVAGIGIDGAARGMDSRFRSPLLADKDDAKALVELLYYAVTGRWPGKHSGYRPAPRRGGMPVPPSEIASGVAPEINALCERVWKGDVPRSAAEVAALLTPWPKVVPPRQPVKPTPVATPPAPVKPAAPALTPVAKPAPEVADASATGGALAEAGTLAAAATSTVVGATRSFFTRISHSMRTGQFSPADVQQVQPAQTSPVNQPPVPKMITPEQPGSPADVVSETQASAPASSPAQVASPGQVVSPTTAGTPMLAATPAFAGAPTLADGLAAEALKEQANQEQAGLQQGSPGLRARRGGGHPVLENSIPTVVVGPGQSPQRPGPESTRVVSIDSVRGSGVPVAVESDLITIADANSDGSDLLVEDSELEELVAGEQAESRRISTGIMMVIAAVVLLVVLFAIFNLLNLAKVPLTDQEIPAAKTVPSQSAAAQDGVQSGGQQGAPAAAPVLTGAQVLDSGEHPELAGTMTDGDVNTGWYTRYYDDPSVPNNGKSGVGVAFPLQAAATVSAVELQGTADGGHFELRSTTAQDPAGGTLLAEGAFVGGTTSISVSPVEASNLVLWVTEFPRTTDGKNRVTISEVTVR